MICDDYRAGVSATSPTLEDFATLRADNERLAAERDQYRELYLRTLEQCRKLELGLLGKKSERLSGNDAQLTMSVLATLLGERPAADGPVLTQPVRETRDGCASAGIAGRGARAPSQVRAQRPSPQC